MSFVDEFYEEIRAEYAAASNEQESDEANNKLMMVKTLRMLVNHMTSHTNDISKWCDRLSDEGCEDMTNRLRRRHYPTAMRSPGDGLPEQAVDLKEEIKTFLCECVDKMS